MKIRRFTGTTMAEALKGVKAALGPEAVILDTTAGDVGVVVTAAVDDDDPSPDAVALEEPPPPRAAEADRVLVDEVRGLLTAVHELVDAQWSAQLPGVDVDLVRLHRRLVADGVDG